MKNFKILSTIKFLFTLVLLVSITVACSNSTSGNEEEHSEPEGFVLKMNGQIIVEQLPDQSVTGEFELTAGQETDLVTIFFLDHDGEEFQPEEAENSLGYEFDTQGIANFEQHTEDGKWSFHIHAEAEGTTNLRLKLMHSGHSDFTTQYFPINVAATQ